MQQPAATRFKWGKSRFANVPAMRIALPIGMVISLAFASIRIFVNHAPQETNWFAIVGGTLIFWACLLVPSVMLVWVIVVDRATIPGAEARPEESVETQWMGRAASTAFWVIIATAGVGSAIISLFTDSQLNLVLAAVTVFGMIVYAVAYFAQKYR